MLRSGEIKFDVLLRMEQRRKIFYEKNKGGNIISNATHSDGVK